MKNRVEALLILCASMFVFMQGLRKRLVASFVEPYCRRVQASSIARVRRLRETSFRFSMLALVLTVHEGLAQTSTRELLPQQHSSGPPRSHLKKILRSTIFLLVVVYLRATSLLVELEREISSLILRGLIAQADSDNLRLKSFELIMENRSSPIFWIQVLFWLTTRAKSLEWVLGELVEGYDRKTAKYGKSGGLVWAHRQLKMHLINLGRTIALVSTGLGWLLRMIHKHHNY